MSACRFLLAALQTLNLLCIVTQATALAADAPERPYGIDKRIPWTTSRIVGSPEPPSPYKTTRVFEKLTVKQPIYARPEPGTGNYLVVEHHGSWSGPGRIARFPNDPTVTATETVIEFDHLIYGFCFHPRFLENGYIYLMSNGPVKGEPKLDRISRYTLSREAPHAVIPDSQKLILEWESNGHNGGELAFGPDGMLYCATGDGTSDSDPKETGQGVDDLLSVMIRIDVDHPTDMQPYSIPKDNPFLDHPGARPEIWAFGFRNPWRMTFDKLTGHLWCTQNGQDLWEQVYLVRRGENYGWSVQEGGHPFYPDRKVGPGPIVPPVADHHHSEARSLTGGIVYYGDKLPDLRGAYIYGDFSTGRIWGLKHDGQKLTWHQELVDTPFAIVGFCESPEGDLLVIDQQTGFHKLEPAPVDPDPPKFPTKLSETGLFAAVKDHVVEPALIPYSVNAPLWSDGSHKERYIALPGDSQIEFPGPKSWGFPEGTVLVKTFALDREAGNPATRQRIETRLMTKQQNEWIGYTYEWNDEQTDAVLVERNGKDKDFVIRDAAAPNGSRTQTWHYPSRAECLVCHSRAATFVLGLQTEQMNRNHDYGGIVDNQLRTLNHLGLFLVDGKKETGLTKPPSEYPAFVDPADETQPLEPRVRAYLHVNCATCHQHAGGGNAQIELPFSTKLAEMKLVDVVPNHDKFGIENARLVAPGEPDRSVLLARMTRRGRGQMPPLASALVDEQAVKLLEAWVKSLPTDATAR